MVKKAKQALIEEQERKNREYEERMATAELRKQKEIADYKKYKAVSKHQVILNYIDRERQAEQAVVKDKVLPVGLGDDHIWLNIQHDLQEHSEVLTQGLSKSKITHRIKRDAATHHYSINITSLNQLQAEVTRIANEELTKNPLFMMNIVFGYTLEQPTEDGPYNYINAAPNHLRQLRAPMFIRKEHAENNLQTFTNKIQDDLLHLYEIDYQTSSVKPVCLYKAILLVYLVSHLAGPIVIPPELIKMNKHLDTHQDHEFNLCFWFAAYKFTSGATGDSKVMGSKVKEMCYKFCNPKATHIDRGVISRFLREYPGFDLMKDIQRYMDMYKHNVLIYKTLDNKTFKLVQRHIYSNDSPTMRLLMISGPLKANPKKTGTHKKKLLGACYEHEGENMICMGPKCYTLWSLGDKKPTQKSKGFPIKTAGVTCQAYSDALYGQNYSDYTSHLQFLAGDIHKVTLLKVALSGRHTKMIVQSDHSCLPFPPKEFKIYFYVNMSYNYSKKKGVNVTPRKKSELNWTFHLVDKIKKDPVKDPEGYWRRKIMEEKASNDIDDWES